MYCSDEREIAVNILCFSFKRVYTVLGTISKSLHISEFDFSIYYRYFGVDSNALLLLVVDMIAMANENAS